MSTQVEEFVTANVSLNEIMVDDDLNEARGKIVPFDVRELMQDLEAQGMIQPVVLSRLEEPVDGKKYRLIAGYRRTHAARYLRWETIPAVIRPPMSEVEARILNFSENLQRKDLSLLQQAKAVKRLRDLDLSLNDIGKRLNQTYGWVQVRHMLLKLPKDIQENVENGIFTQTNVRELYTIKEKHGIDEMYKSAIEVKKAREAGKKNVQIEAAKRKPSPNMKQHRKRHEIIWLLDHLLDNYGAGIHTKCLAWAAGEISDKELHDAVHDYAEAEGKTYIHPLKEE